MTTTRLGRNDVRNSWGEIDCDRCHVRTHHGGLVRLPSGLRAVLCERCGDVEVRTQQRDAGQPVTATAEEDRSARQLVGALRQAEAAGLHDASEALRPAVASLLARIAAEGVDTAGLVARLEAEAVAS